MAQLERVAQLEKGIDKGVLGEDIWDRGSGGGMERRVLFGS